MAYEFYIELILLFFLGCLLIANSKIRLPQTPVYFAINSLLGLLLFVGLEMIGIRLLKVDAANIVIVALAGVPGFILLVAYKLMLI